MNEGPPTSFVEDWNATGMEVYDELMEENTMNVPLTPLFDKILIKRPPEMEETPGGVLIPSTAREKAMNGEVISIGSDVKHVKVGQIVMFRKYAGTDISFNDENQYLIISEQDVLGIMKEE